MGINSTNHGRRVLANVGDTVQVGKKAEGKGFKKHSTIVGAILSVVGLTFKDQDAKWVNKKSVVHYLKRNSENLNLSSDDKASVTQLNVKSSAKEVKALFQKAKNAPKADQASPTKNFSPTLNAVAGADKLFKSISDPVDELFTPLSDDEVRDLLDQEPELRNRNAAQDTMKAHHSIFAIQKEGIPGRLGEGSQANETLKNSMQFILYKISLEPNKEKRKGLLANLASCVEDCVPVTQGSIALMHMQLAAMGGVEPQVAQFILRAKDRAFDAALYEVHPEMQSLSYAQENHSMPSKQFPHIKTGYLAKLGAEFGLNCVGVEEDQNRNTALTPGQVEAVKEAFQRQFSVQEVIQEFIKDINERRGEISANDLYQWCATNGIQETEHNPDLTYPSYSTLMGMKDKKVDGKLVLDDKKNVIKESKPVVQSSDADMLCYLTEDLAVTIFRKMEYVV